MPDNGAGRGMERRGGWICAVSGRPCRCTHPSDQRTVSTSPPPPPQGRTVEDARGTLIRHASHACVTFWISNRSRNWPEWDANFRFSSHAVRYFEREIVCWKLILYIISRFRFKMEYFSYRDRRFIWENSITKKGKPYIYY